jgi:hypothetical protein
LLDCNKIKHYQKFAKYQRIYWRNISVGNLRSELPTDTFPSVIQSVTTDEKFFVRNSVGNYRRKYSVGSYRLNYGQKSFLIKKRQVADVEVLAGHFSPTTSPTASKMTARTVTWPVRHLHYRRTHRGIWNGRSVWWRVYVSVRITDVITDWFTDGISVSKN